MIRFIEAMKTQVITIPSLAAVLCLSPTLLAEPTKPVVEKKIRTMKVEVLKFPAVTEQNRAKGPGADKDELMTVELEYVTYNHDRSQFVGYYQHGWFEMVSLHDAKTKKRMAHVYCEGGAPTVFRFSKCGKFLGAKASVGWYVWKIPTFDEVLILGDTDFYSLQKKLGVMEKVKPTAEPSK